MASTGFTLAGAGSNVTGVGTEAWGTPGNITADDSSYASGAAASKDEQMNYLKGASFGFNIPANSSINGIELRVRAKDSEVLGIAKLTHAIIGKSDSTLGSDLISTDVSLTTTDTLYTYGSSTEKWGLTWTPSDINSSSFQGRVSANASNISGASAGNPVVNAMWINVHYTPPLTASTGAFTLTGKSAVLSRGRIVLPTVGAFSLIGNAADLSRTVAVLFYSWRYGRIPSFRTRRRFPPNARNSGISRRVRGIRTGCGVCHSKGADGIGGPVLAIRD